jgi:flagellar M-ring protein FliF
VDGAAVAGIGVEPLLRTLRSYGIGRLAAILGAAAGAAAILIAVMLRVGGDSKSLLYANLDMKEASQIASALDAAGVKYELKGDGSTIFVDRDKVASARLMLSGKGLPTSGSVVGYELFDTAPAMGQTDFVQNLNRQRALEGELTRTISGIRGVSFAKVFLVLPKRQLFEQDTAQPTASVVVATNGGRLSDGQVRTIRNLVAGAVPDLKPDHVTVSDQQGELLAAEGDDDIGDAGGGARSQTEERIRHTVKDLVEGIVGPGKARVQVSADLDLDRVTVQDEKYDPDGQVVLSTGSTDNKQAENKSQPTGLTSASQNVPGAQAGSSSSPDTSNTTGHEETTNYDVSKTTTTKIQEPGRVKRLSVAVAVDWVPGAPVNGKPGPYRPRTPEEMAKIQELVESAVGYDESRHDQVKVVNVRFDPAIETGGVVAASPFDFDKNDIMRAAELAVMVLVAALIVFFVVKPMLSVAGGGAGAGMAAGGHTSGGALAASGHTLSLAAPDEDLGIDIARIEGQVRASSVKKVAEFVEKHPDESVSILRSWLHES